jgi:hypothetical protein
MAAIGLLVAVPVTLLVRGGSGERSSAGPALNGGRTSPSIPEQFRLRRSVRLHGLGVGVRVPHSWRARRTGGTIRLRSDDGTTALAVAAPSRAGKQQEVLRSELGAIKHGYEDVAVRRGVGRSVGGLTATGAVVSARNTAGTPLRILIAVASGEAHTYLVDVFSAANAPPERLVQAQLALGTLTLSR